MQPVKRQLKKYLTYCQNDSEYKRQLDSISRVVKSKEWEIVVKLLWWIKNEMAIELLQSSKFTKDSAESKDITQKVYNNISEWIDFLVNPPSWIKKKGLIQILQTKIKGDKPERKESK